MTTAVIGATAVPYSTIGPAIFSASLLAAAPEVRASRTWIGLAGTGRTALIDHRDAAEAGCACSPIRRCGARTTT
jgi:NAD(P)H dehydrogenase (quinone)